jgi:hypothetical protein
MNMEKTKSVLSLELWCAVILALAIIVMYETGALLPGSWAGNANTLFVCSSVMELLTIAAIPFALYMFRIPKIQGAITTGTENSKASMLLMWGTIRMLLLCVPMVVNAVFYYMFGLQVAFGYMGIILFICLFMVYPSMGRCLNETNSTSQGNEA